MKLLQKIVLSFFLTILTILTITSISYAIINKEDSLKQVLTKTFDNPSKAKQKYWLNLQEQLVIIIRKNR